MLRASLSLDYLGDLDDRLVAKLHDARQRMADARRPFRSSAYLDARTDYDWSLYQLAVRRRRDLPEFSGDAPMDAGARRGLEDWLRGEGLDIPGEEESGQ